EQTEARPHLCLPLAPGLVAGLCQPEIQAPQPGSWHVRCQRAQDTGGGLVVPAQPDRALWRLGGGSPGLSSRARGARTGGIVVKVPLFLAQAPTVSAAMAGENNFTLLRLALAVAVVVSHSVSVTTGSVFDEPLAASTGFTLGEHAVNGFFAISGF